MNTQRMTELDARLAAALASKPAAARRAAPEIAEAAKVEAVRQAKDKVRESASDLDVAEEKEYAARFGEAKKIQGFKTANVKELEAILNSAPADADIAESWQDLQGAHTGANSTATKVKGLATVRRVKAKEARERFDAARYAALPELDALKADLLLQAIGACDAWLATFYALPILPVDLSAGGRFMRSIKWHDRQVGMLSLDYEDIFSEALLLCYLPENAATDTAIGGMPTIGAMYRNVKRAHGAAIDRFRHALAGEVVETSLDVLTDAGIELGSRWDHYGVEYVSSEDMPWEVLAESDDLPADIMSARGEAHRRALIEMMSADAEAAEVKANRVKALRITGDTVETIAIEMIVAGLSITEVAGKLGIQAATLQKRLMAVRVAPALQAA